MNKLELINLSEILKCRYAHICLNWVDIDILKISPPLKKNYYPFRHGNYKRGVYIWDNYQTMVWIESFGGLEQGHIKISNGDIKLSKFGIPEGWAHTFSFKEEDSPMTIYKTMKMKVFW